MSDRRPTVTELVEAVREFLDHDVAAATEGRVRFHTRVAVNVLAIVERELRLEPSHREAQRQRWERLGVRDDADLAARIRSGRLDHRWDEVVDLVRAAVRDRLEIDHPGYSGEPPHAPTA